MKAHVSQGGDLQVDARFCQPGGCSDTAGRGSAVELHICNVRFLLGGWQLGIPCLLIRAEMCPVNRVVRLL